MLVTTRESPCMCAKSLQSCPTLCNSMNCSLPGSLSMGFSRQEYWSGCHALLQGIFPIQGPNPGLLHCRQILDHLSTRESLYFTWGQFHFCLAAGYTQDPYLISQGTPSLWQWFLVQQWACDPLGQSSLSISEKNTVS